jgi:hypothetical protein
VEKTCSRNNYSKYRDSSIPMLKIQDSAVSIRGSYGRGESNRRCNGDVLPKTDNQFQCYNSGFSPINAGRM